MNEPALEIPASPRVLRPSWLADLLPFLTSLSLHATIVVVGLLTYQAIKVVREQPAPPVEMTFTPESPIVRENPVPDGMHRIGSDSNALKQWMKSEVAEESQTFRAHRADSDARLGEVGSGDAGAGSEMAGFLPGRLGTALGPGLGDASGTSSGRFGAPGGGGPAGGPIFAPTNGAHKIAFLCDASGSMITKMGSLKVELAKSMMALKPSQSFSVIFFQDRSCKSFSRELAAANSVNKHQAMLFLEDVGAGGQTDPIPALELAFRQKPEIIYLLTDGDFPDNGAVLRKIQTLNAGKGIRINTIALVGMGDTDTSFIALLRQIAQETHGTYRHVSEDDLQ